jgi:hypothetical protein
MFLRCDKFARGKAYRKGVRSGHEAEGEQHPAYEQESGKA